ncbi:MAG TPA: dienelactone hydrolase family protein [Dehalococcoidia bacterium]|nr:dienelactone hydrolase family protein [Dehalococcoidia bacterium]
MDFTDEPPDNDNRELELAIENVAAHPEPDGNLRVLIATSRGEIRAILHPCATAPAAAIYVGGAMGGFEGPANDIYGRLADRLRPRLSGLRIHYRHPGEFQECVLDVLAGVSLLRGFGATGGIALVGHSFGGAVVIKAGELSPAVAGVAALSPQIYGTRTVERLARPLLLVHGMRDSVLDHAASEDIHARAVEPKRLVLYAEADHSLDQAAADLEELLAAWLPETVGRTPAFGVN